MKTANIFFVERLFKYQDGTKRGDMVSLTTFPVCLFDPSEPRKKLHECLPVTCAKCLRINNSCKSWVASGIVLTGFFKNFDPIAFQHATSMTYRFWICPYCVPFGRVFRGDLDQLDPLGHEFHATSCVRGCFPLSDDIDKGNLILGNDGQVLRKYMVEDIIDGYHHVTASRWLYNITEENTCECYLCTPASL